MLRALAIAVVVAFLLWLVIVRPMTQAAKAVGLNPANNANPALQYLEASR